MIKAHRVWIEIVLIGAAIACALALLIATLGAAADAAVDSLAVQEGTVPAERVPTQQDPAATEHTYVGMVTCTRCKAKHSPSMGQTADVCVRVCVHSGAHFALVNAESVYLLEGDMAALKKAAGQRVRVIGNLKGGTIRVESVLTQS